MNLGLQIARELVAAGDQVVFLAPAALAMMLRDAPVRHRPVDGDLFDLDRALFRVAAQERCHSVVLIDALSVFSSLDDLGLDDRFLQKLDPPLVALDVWNLGETDLNWDHGGGALAIAPLARDIPRRLTPVPLARPTCSAGAYNALPPAFSRSPSQREALRQEMGLGPEDKLVLTASSTWQSAELQKHNSLKRLARLLPSLVAETLIRLGPRLHLAHVAPAPFPAWAPLGPRYHWLPFMEPARFQALLDAADMVLSFNTSATTTALAVRTGVPVVLGINSHAGRTPEEVAAALPQPPSAALCAWLTEACPLYRFRAWPLGLFSFLEPVLAANPYTTAFRTVEVLDQEAFFQGCHELLFDPAARESEGQKQEAYCRLVEGLPGAGEVLRSYL